MSMHPLLYPKMCVILPGLSGLSCEIQGHLLRSGYLPHKEREGELHLISHGLCSWPTFTPSMSKETVLTTGPDFFLECLPMCQLLQESPTAKGSRKPHLWMMAFSQHFPTLGQTYPFLKLALGTLGSRPGCLLLPGCVLLFALFWLPYSMYCKMLQTTVI